MEYRVEKKYICTNMELAILKARLQAVMSIDKNQKEIDAYQIRSIYFDNYDNSSYFENDAGVDDRKKLRIRVYNKSRKTIKLKNFIGKMSRVFIFGQRSDAYVCGGNFKLWISSG